MSTVDEVARLRAEAARVEAEANRLAIEIGENRRRLAMHEAKAQTKFLHDPTILGDWLPAQCRAAHPIVLALVYFMYLECHERWPTVEQLVSQLCRDYRLHDGRARQVIACALAEADTPLALEAHADTWLVTIDVAAHADLNEDYVLDQMAFDNTYYPPESST